MGRHTALSCTFPMPFEIWIYLQLVQLRLTAWTFKAGSGQAWYLEVVHRWHWSLSSAPAVPLVESVPGFWAQHPGCLLLLEVLDEGHGPVGTGQVVAPWKERQKKWLKGRKETTQTFGNMRVSSLEMKPGDQTAINIVFNFLFGYYNEYEWCMKVCERNPINSLRYLLIMYFFVKYCIMTFKKGETPSDKRDKVPDRPAGLGKYLILVGFNLLFLWNRLRSKSTQFLLMLRHSFLFLCFPEASWRTNNLNSIGKSGRTL